MPTSFKTLTPPGGSPASVPGSGTDHRAYAHAGGEAHVTLGDLARPLAFTAVWLYGQEDAALTPGAVQTARFHGGFAGLDYTLRLPLTLFFRWDRVLAIQQANPMLPGTSGDATASTLGARYAAWLSAWGSLIAHAEVGTVRTDTTDVTPLGSSRSTNVFAGLDFAM